MNHRRLKAKVPIVRSNSLPRMSYPHMASLDVEIGQQGSSSVGRIFPTRAFSTYLAQGEAQSQGPYESNYEFSSPHSAFDVNSDAPVNVYCVMGFRPNYFTCTAHLYLYCTLLVPHTYASYIRH